MVERVRLLVWDLDETFWGGTLTEGGISFSDENKRIVIELAKRGIVSSICSKNDFTAVRDVLVAHDIWDCFVLPSISWDPKGPRIAALIDTFGLRPPTVMFVDDNPLNLAEVRNCVPGIQTEPHTFIAEILDSPLFQGKDDRDLTRLKQYKVLEQRQNEAAAAPDIHQFLKDSDIRVRLEFDVASHLDRFIELINRTNQLNFTKTRLPEEPAAARVEATRILTSYMNQCALVHVSDRYGDHGFCGAYVHNSELRQLDYFCFSCRILGMGVERWLYQLLGSPEITVVGEVLADLFDPSEIDWIAQVSDTTDSRSDHGTRFASVAARGSCDLGAVTHYFRTSAKSITAEYHVFRDNKPIRLDHSVVLRSGLRQMTGEEFAIAGMLGFARDDFQSDIFKNTSGKSLVLLSFGADPDYHVYRHRDTGLELPFTMSAAVEVDVRLVEKTSQNASWHDALDLLQEEFDFVGLIDEAPFKANLICTLERYPRDIFYFHH